MTLPRYTRFSSEIASNTSCITIIKDTPQTRIDTPAPACRSVFTRDASQKLTDALAHHCTILVQMSSVPDNIVSKIQDVASLI